MLRISDLVEFENLLMHDSLVLIKHGIPSAIDATLDALIRGALLGVRLQRALNGLALPGRNSQPEANPDLRDFQDAVHFFDVTLDVGDEVLC